MAIDFNVDPYYDDFLEPGTDGLAPQDKYHKILFRPAHAVQARELTQLQSILQNQITQFGRHFFEEGSMVIPGQLSIETKIDYIKIDSMTNADDATDLIGLTFTDGDGLEFKVVHGEAFTDDDPDTIYVKYLTAGNTNTVMPDSTTATSGDITITTSSEDAAGFGSIISLDDGIYFTEGTFIAVQKDTIVLDKYNANPSYDAGLKITESINSIANDVSLGDPSQGTPNEAAPGAHRYTIKSKLIKRDIGDDTGLDKFILLARIKDGVIQQQVRETEYSVLEETLARRTFDESGDYTIRPFLISVREHDEVHNSGADDKLAVVVEPSKAYVKGYEIETLSSIAVDVDKARTEEDTAFFESAFLTINIGNYIEVIDPIGVPDIASFGSIELRDAPLLSNGNNDPAADVIGYCRARSIDYRGNGVYRIYLFDIQMNSVDGRFEDFSAVKSMSGGSTPAFRADVVLRNIATIDGTTNYIAQRNYVSANKLVFKLPFDRVKTLDSTGSGGESADYNIEYFTIEDAGVSPIAGGECYFEVAEGSTFTGFDPRRWILVEASGANAGNIIDFESIYDLDPANNFESSNAGKKITLRGLGSYDGIQVRLIAGVVKKSIHKTKTLVTNNIPNVSYERFGQDPGTTSLPDTLYLEEADGFRLLKVYMAPDFETEADATHLDVTDYYNFNNGQTDNFYGPSFITRKSGTAFRPTGQLRVEYEFFRHVGDGDFFSRDSYRGIVSGVDGYEVVYEDIPNYNTSDGENIELRSAIDFRPRINTDRSFTGNTTNIPQPNSTFSTDIIYFLNRVDSLYLDKNGEFGITRGVPAIKPEVPEPPKDAMVLYNLTIPGYTLTPKEVGIAMIDNKRYTMRDIGKLEKRINNLEYYTTLSLLEKDAATKEISDTVFGQRAKAGFIVDGFTSHKTGKVTDPEYKAAIDRERHCLRPSFHEDNVRLKLGTSSSNVVQTGNLITLPWTEVVLEDQNKSSDAINVNPFDVFEWTGTLELSPTSDEWIDTGRRPDLIANQEGVYDAMVGIADAAGALGTVWNNWQTNWTGVQSSSTSSRVGRQITTTTTTITTTDESRTGIETFVVPDTINTNIGDRIVELNFSPFIRSRIIHFRATRLKPNTRVYPFFDGVPVADYCRQESQFYNYQDPEVVNNPVIEGQNDLTEHPVGGGSLTTDAAGNLNGSFFIPNNVDLSFNCGTRIFKLTDDANNVSNTTTTQAEAAYNAKGLLQTKENVTLSTRVPLVERREVSDNRIVSNTRVSTQVRWVDPLAQSFMVTERGGAFLTSIDVYFHKKSNSIPVTLQIREMQNGIPTQIVVPFSEVTLSAGQVNVMDIEGGDDPDPSLGTKFTFESPVYLQDNQEYCFVLMANSNDYEVYYGAIGGVDQQTGLRISKQPYAGVMFKSQNASTWSPDQNKDLKFTLNRAKFTIEQGNTANPQLIGNVVLENAPLPARTMLPDPFFTTEGSNVVRVNHPNHGLFRAISDVTSEVQFAMPGSDGTPDVTIPIVVNGLTLNGTHIVSDVDLQGYSVTIDGATASGTGVGGGRGVSALSNIAYDTFYPFIQQLVLPSTNILYGVRTTTGAAFNSTASAPYNTLAAKPIIANQNYVMENPMVVASPLNKAGASMFVLGYMTSNRDNLSPVIDLERCSVITVSNKINNPNGTDGINHAESHSVYDFIPETATTGGSAAAKYVTKTVQLQTGSTGLRIFVDINRPSQTFVDVYYKTASDQSEIDTTPWILATPDNGIVPYSDSGEFLEVGYDIDPLDTAGNPAQFTAFTVKIVMQSSNTSKVPLCRNLRIIAVD